MPILTKDGKPYRTFSEPNPLMLEQDELPVEKLVFHNFSWIPTIVPVRTKKLETPKKQTVERPLVGIVEETTKARSEEITDFLDLLKKEAVTLRKEAPPVPKPVSNDPMDGPEVVLVHCHPVIVREHHDEFYGETRTSLDYGQKFEIEALIVEFNDIELVIYTKHAELTRGTILFPSKYKNGKRLEMLRWWELKRIQSVKDGYLVWAGITDKHRDFSD